MTDSTPKEVVIGIRHTLKVLKEQGLIEEATLYPDEAVSDLNNQILHVAKQWYKIGAKRGADEIIEEFLNGNLEVVVKSDGSREVIRYTEEVSWTRTLKVTVGNSQKEVKQQKYRLSYDDDLGFSKD